MSERYDCTDPDERAEGIPAAAAAVRRGEVVVLPTDTVYGIGCDAFDANAVASVLAAKGRGRDMPPPVLIPTARTAQGLATEVPDYAQRLMEKFWPGPLTLVLKAQTSLHWDLGETNGTVALRVPDNAIALDLLADIGPMAVTSANTTGDPAARSVDEAVGMLGESVAVYLDGGAAAEGEASTIVDCTGESPVTLRFGAITQDEIVAAMEHEPDTEPDAEPETEPDSEPEPEPDSEPDAEPDAEPETEPETEPKPATEERTDAGEPDLESHIQPAPPVEEAAGPDTPARRSPDPAAVAEPGSQSPSDGPAPTA